MGFVVLAGFFPVSIWLRSEGGDSGQRSLAAFLLIASSIVIVMSVINDGTALNWRVHERYWYVFIPFVMGLWLSRIGGSQGKSVKAALTVRLALVWIVAVCVAAAPFYAQGWSMTDAPSLILLTALVRKLGVVISMVLVLIALWIWFGAWGNLGRLRVMAAYPWRRRPMSVCYSVNTVTMTTEITGGAGFIGCNFVRHMLGAHPELEIVNLDKLTYAGSLDNLKDVMEHPRHRFVQGDIGDGATVRRSLSTATGKMCATGCMSRITAGQWTQFCTRGVSAKCTMWAETTSGETSTSRA